MDDVPDITSVTFTKTTLGSGKDLLFYKQKEDGTYAVNDVTTYDNIVSIPTSSGFSLTNKYTGYQLTSYRCNTGTTRTAWFFPNGTEYQGTNFYATTTANTGTQYGVVNGEIVQLSQGV